MREGNQDLAGIVVSRLIHTAIFGLAAAWTILVVAAASTIPQEVRMIEETQVWFAVLGIAVWSLPMTTLMVFAIWLNGGPSR